MTLLKANKFTNEETSIKIICVLHSINNDENTTQAADQTFIIFITNNPKIRVHH